MSPLRSAAGAARHYNLRLPTEGPRPGHGPAALGPAPGFKGLRLTAGRRPKGGYVGPTFASFGQVGPMFAYVSRILPQVGPVLALCSRILAVCWPMSALCWPYVGLSWPYLGPMWPHHVDKFCQTMLKHLQLFIFFPSGAAPEPKNHVKRVVF